MLRLRLAWPALLLALAAVAAVRLPFPPEARGLLDQIHAACPECRELGWIPCGTADIGPGSGFAPNLLQGDPARGYLLATRYVDRFAGWYRDASLAHEEVAGRVRDVLAESRLVVVEAGFAAARPLGAPERVEPQIAPEHRGCLAEPEAFGCNGAECCNKTHGRTRVRAIWRDPADGEALVFEHQPAAAQTLLRRGGLAYWCLAWESGRLTVD